jgi:hypothetical protein
MKVPLITKLGGICIIFCFGLLFISALTGCENQQSYASEPSLEVKDDQQDDAYGMEQMTDLERRIQQVQQNELPKAAIKQTPREIELEAELSECKSKLSILMYSDSDNPK